MVPEARERGIKVEPEAAEWLHILQSLRAAPMRTRRHSGFTLIELMIVVAIVAILAAIAYPSFADQIRKSRRSEAISNMQDVQLQLEKYRVDHPSYGTFAVPANASTSYYTVAMPAAGATSYTLTATPLGAQTKDACGTLKITATGADVKKEAATTGCW